MLYVQQIHVHGFQFKDTHWVLQAVLQVRDDFVGEAMSPHLTTELCVQAVRSKVASASGGGKGMGEREERRSGVEKEAGGKGVERRYRR